MRRILIADDDQGFRETLAEILKADGAEVLLAKDGATALTELESALASGGLQAAIIDVLMPKMNGLDLAKAIRAKAPQLDIVFMSGVYKSMAQAEEATKAFGAKAYLTKPFDAKRLLDLIGKPPAPGAKIAAVPGAKPLPSGGALVDTPALQLMWRAAREHQSGILDLVSDVERARVFFFRGRVVMAQSSDPNHNVGVELVRAGSLTSEQCTKASALAVERSEGLSEVLRAEGWVDDATLKSAYKTLSPKIVQRLVALQGTFRWTQNEAFAGLVPGTPIGITDALLAPLKSLVDKDLEPFIAKHRALRLAAGEAWSDVVQLLAEACGSDTLAKAINGRATVAQIVEGAKNALDRTQRLRQMFMLLSLNAVKISERAEISAPNAPAPGPGKAAPAPVAEARPANAQPGNHAQAIVGAAALTAEGAAQLDRGLKFTPEEQAARQKIDAKLAEVDGKDYFAMLDVTPASDAAAIKKAYFAVARAFHPDAFPGLNLGSGAAKLNHLYSLLSIAYETLTDPKKRGEYDAKMSFEQTGGSSDVGAIMAAEADFHKAQFLVERGEMKAALGLIERALVAMPANEELMGYKLYAQWWAKRDRAEAANLIRELERLYKAAPAAHAMREFQGWLHLELEDVKKARAAFEYAAQHRPGSQGAAKGIRAVARKQEELDKKSSGGGLGRFLKR